MDKTGSTIIPAVSTVASGGLGDCQKASEVFSKLWLGRSPGGGCFDDAYDTSNVTIPKPWLLYGRNSTWMNTTTYEFVPVMGNRNRPDAVTCNWS